MKKTLCSMTGFAQRHFDFTNRHFHLEIRSVNHKYREISVHLPTSNIELETLVRSYIETMCARGKIDIYLHGSLSGLSSSFQIDSNMVEQYVACAKQLEALYPSKKIAELSVFELLSLPGCLKEMPLEKGLTDFTAIFIKALQNLLVDFLAARRKEGSFLATGLLQGLAQMSQILEEVELKTVNFEPEALERLRQRMGKLQLEGIDEHRLYMELGFLLEKLDISEEILRLKSHLQSFHDLIVVDSHEGSGRRMIFLCQEIHREINTIGSKSQNIDISAAVVNFKTLLEGLREQVQNIE